jgi:CRISPR/Cas system-associated exonuclease Cas4 (RecB family)
VYKQYNKKAHLLVKENTKKENDKMKVDVSEVKAYRDCKRKWMYSSRNRYHLKPRAPKSVFLFGTLMHEALHAMYAGGDFDKLFENTLKELTDPAERRVMSTILNGYFETVYQDDAQRYKVIDIEYGFDIPFDVGLTEEIHVCGSIDMITLDRTTNEIWGFEHKSVRTFRDDIYMVMDEQPRVYYIALQKWVKTYNDAHNTDYVLGGIFINECKKTVKEFQHKRTPCIYTQDDLSSFLGQFMRTAIHMYNDDEGEPAPGSLKCQMCDYASLCAFSGFSLQSLESIVDEFEEEYMVRDVDHLEEKVERRIESSED